ncbi:MAG: transcriptional repressor NrdR [Deltaproteobacteria bacterium]|nr:transcriptional repressor NrdR [Deltaproteobacteria bacterium]
MKCPVCDDLGTRVVDSRAAREDTEIRRRRQCDTCSHRFTTYERAERTLPFVIKKDGRREPWNRKKIMGGLTKACEKRPISTDEVEKLADTIADDASASGEPEISSRLIGERIMPKLHDLDEVAYVRFASVYRSFKDLDELMEEVSLLVKGRKKNED